MVSIQSSTVSMLWRSQTWMTTLIASALLTAVLPISAIAQARHPEEIEIAAEFPDTIVADVTPLKPDVAQSGLFSIEAGQRLMAEGQQALNAQDNDLAIQKFQETRRLMNYVSNFYKELRSSFLGLDNLAYTQNQEKAKQAGQLRDEASFELARLYRSQNKPARAIPLLIEVLGSQSPERELGKQADQELTAIGFATPAQPETNQSGLFSIAAGKQLMTEAETAIDGQDYSLASQKLKNARRLTGKLSELYKKLFDIYKGANPEVSDNHRRHAIETGQMRDQTSYQLSLVYRVQNKPEQAIPLLVEIIRSQRPDRELGTKSYQQLLELGFVDTPFPRTSDAQTAPTIGFNTP